MSFAQFRMKMCMDHFLWRAYRQWDDLLAHVRKLADTTVEWRQYWLHLSTRRLSGSLPQRRARVSQSKLATKFDRTHRKRRWRANAVATPVTGFNPVRLFLMGGLWRTLSLCLHSPLISRIFATVSRLLWLWSTVIWLTRVWNEMDYRVDVCHITKDGHILSTVKYVKKKPWRVSLSLGIRTTMISWVVYLLRIFKMFHGLVNHPVYNVRARDGEICTHYAIQPGCRDLSITCAHIMYSRSLSSLEDNLTMASMGRNM